LNPGDIAAIGVIQSDLRLQLLVKVP
jgi:hypothetical protein